MIGVNLIPPGVLAARKRGRRIRQWVVVTAIVAAVSAVPILLEWRQQARLVALQERKQQADARLGAVRAELAELTHSLTELNERIERADRLRTKRPWAALLSLIVRQMPEEVWLTSLGTGEPQEAAGGKPGLSGSVAASEQGEVVVMEGARKIDLAGFAVDHEHLYDFMTRLKQSRAFAQVELVKAGKEPLLRSRAVRFELTCRW